MSWRRYLLTGLLVAGLPAAGSAEHIGEDVARLFKSGPSTGRSKEAADQVYKQLALKASDDWRIHYAYALALIDQRRYSEAKDALDVAVRSDDRDITLRCAVVWSQMLTRDLASALESATWTAQRLSNNPEPKDEERRHDAVKLLGSVFGFVETVGKEAVSAQELWQHKVAVLKTLGAERAKVFEEARIGAIQQFERLSKEQEEIFAKAEADQRDEQERAQVAVEYKKDTAGNAALEVKDKAKVLQEELKELPRLNEQMQSLLERKQFIDLKAAAIYAKIAQLKEEFETLDDLGEKKPHGRLGLIQSQIARHNFELMPLNAEAMRLRAQAQDLTARRDALVTRQEFESRKLRKKAGQIKQAQAQVAAVEKQLGKPKKLVSPVARALESKIDSFTTYYEFPLDKERSRVMTLLGAVK